MSDLRPPSEPTMGFRGRVPVALAEEFADYFPMFGSNTWFITTMLEIFMDRVRKDPSIRQIMEQEIDSWVKEMRQKGHVLSE